MSPSRVLVLLAFALFVVACVSASGAEGSEGQSPAITKETAKQAVELANKTIKDVCDKAQSKINDATALLGRVESANQKAEREKAQADKAPQDNTKAKDLVKSITNIVKTISTSFLGEKAKLETAIKSMKQVQKEAETLETQCGEHGVAIEASPADYTDIQTKVSALKNNADQLDTRINNALTPISGVDATAGEMEKDGTIAQLANMNINGIVDVANIETKLREAHGIIKNIQNKKEKVHGIVEEMKKHCTAELMQSNEVIKEQCQIATDALKSATGAVVKAQNAMTTIKQQKGLADTALANVLKTTAVSAAETAMTKVQQCVRKVNEMADAVKSALGTAENDIAKAEDSKQNLQRAMSKDTSNPGTEEDTKTEKTDPAVVQGTEADQKDTTIQPTSKDSLEKSNNSAEKQKDTLTNGAQNEPKTALTGGKAPAPGAKNDSAMTVSVPLLVALIASAALQ